MGGVVAGGSVARGVVAGGVVPAGVVTGGVVTGTVVGGVVADGSVSAYEVVVTSALVSMVVFCSVLGCVVGSSELLQPTKETIQKILTNSRSIIRIVLVISSPPKSITVFLYVRKVGLSSVFLENPVIQKKPGQLGPGYALRYCVAPVKMNCTYSLR